MGSAGFLPLGRSALINTDNLHNGCECSLISVLSEDSNYCIKILLILVWVSPYCGDCCGQLVTPDDIQQVLNLPSGISAVVPIFHKVYQDNMILDMSGNILFPVPCLCKAILASDPITLITWNGWHNIPPCHPSWTYAVCHVDTYQWFCRSDSGCHRHYCCLFYTLLHAQ